MSPLLQFRYDDSNPPVLPQSARSLGEAVECWIDAADSGYYVHRDGEGRPSRMEAAQGLPNYLI